MRHNEQTEDLDFFQGYANAGPARVTRMPRSSKHYQKRTHADRKAERYAAERNYVNKVRTTQLAAPAQSNTESFSINPVDTLTSIGYLALADTEKARYKAAAQVDHVIQEISADRRIKTLKYLLSFVDHLAEVPEKKTDRSSKIGQLKIGGTLHSFFTEADNTLRIISDPATSPSEKLTRILKVTPEMHAEMATF